MTRLERLEEALTKYIRIEKLADSGKLICSQYSFIVWLAWRKLDFRPDNIAHLMEEIEAEKIR